MYPASSFQVGKLILTQLQASTNSLKASGVQIQLQVEESVENIEVLMKHLQERSREGTLRSDKDNYALLRNRDSGPGNGSFWFGFKFNIICRFQSKVKDQYCISLTWVQRISKISGPYPSTPHPRSSMGTSGPSLGPTSPPSATQTPTSTLTRTSV